ncbi:MAG: dienelactone hydrolase family protein [Burkholderiales bacterium]|nr:dienelactone hydrolase family protein [Burkholderiales bacterium]
MSSHEETVRIESADCGRFDAYLAVPESAQGPGLVLLQYICGVNAVMRRLAREFAARGYLVAVPDLFWRQEPGVMLANDPATVTAEEQRRALALNDGFADAPALDDMRATLAYLRSHERCNGRVGTLGYCLGGRMAFLLALHSDVDCAVGYYGVNLDKYVGEAPALRCPVLLHMAEKDVLVPPPVREQIVTSLALIENVSVSVHPGVNHAFALAGGPNHDAVAAANADQASLAFLDKHLKAA